MRPASPEALLGSLQIPVFLLGASLLEGTGEQYDKPFPTPFYSVHRLPNRSVIQSVCCAEIGAPRRRRTFLSNRMSIPPAGSLREAQNRRCQNLDAAHAVRASKLKLISER